MAQSISLKGVYKSSKKDGTVYYRSSLTYHQKHISLGSFHSPFMAHQAYLEGSSILNETSILNISDYDSHHAISFDKWVSLINYRDNGIYFGTPIYVFSKYFYYYLSQEIILKFDIEDLFYYSSHKIMKRNGHLFVADYGMQVNIMNRYGIKNYARLNIDYRFINGDENDFRYENIEIFNTYNGVTPINKKGKTYYKCSIHIHGNFLVGVYNDALKAAIAYNKAIDILKKNGITKKFVPNYIEEISPSTYAQIYHKLEISPKIKNYFSL